ncbi:MAG: DNA-deoxyinosine glycosylase [Sneathiellaceae bacterium]
MTAPDPPARKASFPPVADRRTRLLVLGSLPGDASLAAGRYYAHPQNQFWRLMGAVLQVDLAGLGYADRLAALLERRVGLWDSVASATRRGSSDAAIRDIQGNDLPGLVAGLPALRAIAFNGGTAHRLGMRQLGSAAPVTAPVAASGDRLAVLRLPSSSPLHTVGLAAKLPAWLALRAWLD